jgi:peptidoglycan-N-acetylglucosamine deacetylase
MINRWFGGIGMKYIIPIVMLVGFFTLLFIKGAEAYEMEKKNAMPDKIVIDLAIKQNNLEKSNVSLEPLFLKEAQKVEILEEIIESEKESFTQGSVFYGNVEKKKIAYLTFDDGPSNNTKEILDILKSYQIPATFYVNGSDTEFAKEMYRRIVNEGHAIGNHTYSHDYASIYQSKEHFLEDFMKMEQLLIDTVGFAPKIIRYPGGSNNTVSHKYGGKAIMDEIVLEMEQRGYIHSDWNIDSLDTSKVKQSKNVIKNAVLDRAQGKNELIILFHDTEVKTTTVEALPEIIEELIKIGYQFKPMTEETFNIQFKHTRNSSL